MFQLLEQQGVPTHFVEQLSDRETVVKKVSIVPLEVIVRNISAGSFAKRYGVKEGILLQLDDLIEANMPNYMANMGEYIDATRQTGGHIYAICGLNECYHCMYAKKMWVNTYWLDKMGIDVPTTTDEFYDACKKFLEINPTGIAVGGAKDGWHARFEEWMTNAFILSPSNPRITAWR